MIAEDGRLNLFGRHPSLIAVEAADMTPIFSVDFFSEGRRHRMDVHAAGEADVAAFFGLFGTVEGGQITTQAVQRATPALKAGIAEFCVARRADAPQLGAFAKLIAGLADGEAFVVVPARDWTSAEAADLEMLVGWANGTVTEADIAGFGRAFGRVLTEYNLYVARTDRRTQIGNRQVGRRTCRFCRRSKVDGASFDKQAHAISRALGNVHLKLADECDECNEFFGTELEPHLLEFLAMQRVFLGIEGRGGLPRVAGRGGEMLHNGNSVVIAVPEQRLRDEDGIVTIEVPSEIALIPERCYRTLAKFALSVMPEEELPHLATAIDWVRRGARPAGRPLPLVQGAVVPLPPDPSAQLTVYVRKAERSPLPHFVCEFRLGCFLYVFQLPFSDQDVEEPLFIGNSTFSDVFQHYGKVRNWRSHDLGGQENLDSPAVIRIVPQPSSASTTSKAPAEEEAVARTVRPALNSSSHSAERPT